MRKIIFAVLFSMSFSVLGAEEKKEEKNQSVFWSCQTEFKARGRGNSALGLGSYELKGKGLMKCHQVNLFKPRAKEEDRHVVTVTTQEELKALNSYSSEIGASPIEVRIPVSIKSAAKSLLQVNFGRVQIAGFSQQWTLAKDINELLGEFCVANVYGSIGLGAGGFTAIKVGKPSLSLAFAIHGTQGLGFSYGLSKLSIALEEKS